MAATSRSLEPCYRNLLPRNFTVHRLLESLWWRAFLLASHPPPSSRSFILSYPLHIVFQREEFPRGDSLKRKTEPWRCTLAFRSCDDVFHRRLDKRKGTLVRGDQPRENWRERRVTSRIEAVPRGCVPPSKEVAEFLRAVFLFSRKREKEREASAWKFIRMIYNSRNVAFYDHRRIFRSDFRNFQNSLNDLKRHFPSRISRRIRDTIFRSTEPSKWRGTKLIG